MIILIDGSILWKGFFAFICVITAATIKIIIPEEPNRETFRSLLKSIKANDSFNIPTKSLNHDGNP